MSGRDDVMRAGELAAAKAFDAGVQAVLSAVFANVALRDAGLSAQSDDTNECVRYLRQKVWGKLAYDYKPDLKLPVAYSTLYAVVKRADTRRKKATP